jgi:inorganic pyrophosphatase
MNLLRLPTFVDAERRTFRVVVESPKGSAVKLKYDPQSEAMGVSRPLTTGLLYPYDWGFVPGTKMSDNDPLDAFVFWDVASYPGVVIACRALCVLQVEQNRKDGTGRERNDRVVATPTVAARQREVRAMAHVPRRLLQELERFFVEVTAFEHKDIAILGWRGERTALELIRRASHSTGRRRQDPVALTTPRRPR